MTKCFFSALSIILPQEEKMPCVMSPTIRFGSIHLSHAEDAVASTAVRPGYIGMVEQFHYLCTKSMPFFVSGARIVDLAEHPIDMLHGSPQP